MIAALEPQAAAPEKPPAKDRIEELQATVSASRLTLWHSCRLKFFFRYVLRIKKAPTPAMHAGSSVHAVLQQWNMSRSGARIVDFKLVAKTQDVEMVVHTNATQLTSYSVLYRDATGSKEGGLELHHMVRTKKPKLIVTSLPPATEQQVTRLFRSVESYQEGVARQDLVPSPGFACMCCEYLGECRRATGKEYHG